MNNTCYKCNYNICDVRISDEMNSPEHFRDNKPKSLYSLALFNADILIAEK